ncbi:hypothetical protein CHUAL_010383 [Chamberlinius hualienensis]
MEEGWYSFGDVAERPRGDPYTAGEFPKARKRYANYPDAFPNRSQLRVYSEHDDNAAEHES